MNKAYALFRGWCERFNVFYPVGESGKVARLTSNRSIYSYHVRHGFPKYLVCVIGREIKDADSF